MLLIASATLPLLNNIVRSHIRLINSFLLDACCRMSLAAFCMICHQLKLSKWNCCCCCYCCCFFFVFGIFLHNLFLTFFSCYQKYQSLFWWSNISLLFFRLSPGCCWFQCQCCMQFSVCCYCCAAHTKHATYNVCVQSLSCILLPRVATYGVECFRCCLCSCCWCFLFICFALKGAIFSLLPLLLFNLVFVWYCCFCCQWRVTNCYVLFLLPILGLSDVLFFLLLIDMQH